MTAFSPHEILREALQHLDATLAALDRINGFISWKRMGEIEVGDFVLDENGEPCKVEFATEVMHDHLCYEVGITGGERIVCDAEHLWYVHTGFGWETRKTASLVDQYG